MSIGGHQSSSGKTDTWLNPPYSSRDVGPWMKKLADHGCGTALVFARTETEWFSSAVWAQASALLFIRGRLFFHDAAGVEAAANAGAPSVLVAYGAADAEALRRCSVKGAFVPAVRPTLEDMLA